MRSNKASTTAKLVTLWRALADGGATSVPGFRDPFAAQMLGGGFGKALTLQQGRFDRMTPARRARAVQAYDTIPIRVAYIDAALVEAVKQGCRQIVILGAGFDTRAYRLEALAGLKVFEVDHPATQADKRERVRALPRALAEVVWTAVDFERDSLADRLARAGHDAAKPTVWVWEGVVMYLADEAVTGTLGAIRARSAAGSALVLHYHEPSASRLSRGVRALILSWIGEPQIGVRVRAAMRRLVERAGFVVASDLGTTEQALQVGGVGPDNDLARVSRILVARAD